MPVPLAGSSSGKRCCPGAVDSGRGRASGSASSCGCISLRPLPSTSWTRAAGPTTWRTCWVSSAGPPSWLPAAHWSISSAPMFRLRRFTSVAMRVERRGRDLREDRRRPRREERPGPPPIHPADAGPLEARPPRWTRAAARGRAPPALIPAVRRSMPMRAAQRPAAVGIGAEREPPAPRRPPSWPRSAPCRRPHRDSALTSCGRRADLAARAGR